MTPRSFMVIAGEASGDALGAELVIALRQALHVLPSAEAPVFYGVGGEKLAAAGVELIFDLAGNAVFGLEAFGRIFEYRRRFHELLRVAMERRPDALICVDFGGFNRRFAQAVKERALEAGGSWRPKIIQYVSPQVWASRPGRAKKLAPIVDLLLTIFPFEKEWYAARVPEIGNKIHFVGHPVVDRYAPEKAALRERGTPPATGGSLVMFPGSRPSELKRHLPVLGEALRMVRETRPDVHVTMVMPEPLIARARAIGLPPEVDVRSQGLAEALATADVAIAKSGTITLECAFFGVPTVAMYKTSWATYELARRIVSVKWIAMPNILANEEIFPEFVQNRATAENIARTTLEFLDKPERRNYVKNRLRDIVASLGEPGASRRAAQAILGLFDP